MYGTVTESPGCSAELTEGLLSTNSLFEIANPHRY
jgi:hypothetical protein